MTNEEEFYDYLFDKSYKDCYHNHNWKLESAELRGKEQCILKIAKRMLKFGYPIEEISTITELSINQIKELEVEMVD